MSPKAIVAYVLSKLRWRIPKYMSLIAINTVTSDSSAGWAKDSNLKYSTPPSVGCQPRVPVTGNTKVHN